MRVRLLSVFVGTALLLVPVGTASAAGSSSGLQDTFKSSATQKAKRLARVGAVAAPRSTPAPAPTATPTVSYADRVLALTNAQRTSRGLRALAFSSCADRFADTWATTLSTTGTLAHQPLMPILTTCRATSAGENVAYGNLTPEQLVTMWMNSPGHRANILKSSFTHIGIGAVTTSTGRVYGVQVFLTL